jgi:hypothetical protein
MQFKDRLTYQKMICDAYSECQNRLFGDQCIDIEAIISKNIIVIISRGASTMGETSSRITIRGRRIDPILSQIKQEEYNSSMRARLSEITGCNVVSIQPNVFVSSEEKVDVYCMDGDVLVF